MKAIPISEQITELKRELGMRKKLYPEWINGGKLKRKDANAQYTRMEAALQTLMRLEEQNNGKQATLEI